MSPTQLAAFCSPVAGISLRSDRQRRTSPRITMRKGKRQVGPKGPPGFSPEREDSFQNAAERFGIKVPRPGDDFDAKYNAPPTTDKPAPSFYRLLAATFGVDALEVGEKVIYVALGVMLVTFLGSGLAISSEAFFKASGKEISEGMDATLTRLEGAFTPTLLVFLALSSLLGLYKQSQLTSGATAYSTLKDDDRN